MIANQAGATVWKWDQQEPFGSTPPNDNPSGLGAFEFPLRFPGQFADRETGIFYNIFRDYDPGIGRYIQSDPIGVIGNASRREIVSTRPMPALPPDSEMDDEIARASRRITPSQRIGSNLYSYVDSNSLSYTDPEGLIPMVPGPAPSPSPSPSPFPGSGTQVCFAPCELTHIIHIMYLNGRAIWCLYKCFDGTVKSRAPNFFSGCPSSM